MSHLARMSIRLRVTAAFAVAMTLVLAATGIYVHVSLAGDLDSSLNRDLRVRQQDLAALVSSREGGLAAAGGARFVERGETFAQLLDARGHSVDATPTVGGGVLLTPEEIGRARRSPLFLDRDRVPGLDEPSRLLAGPVTRAGRRLVLVVGATRENRAEALRSLRNELVLAGPVALALACALGYILAGTGLRAVEDMRRRAGDISAARLQERLPVPPTGDELERLGTTLNSMLGRLEDALERQRGFVAEAGHELRTPLALLRAELDYAQHHAEGEDELREAVGRASAETDRLVGLAGDLLLIAGSDEGHLPLRLEHIEAARLLDSVRNRFAWRAQAEGRDLVVTPCDGLALTGDPLRLEQALGNIVDNALRHSAGVVTIDARAVEGHVELHVRDAGRGFPGDLLPHAFERFSRADPSRPRGGAGLGLAIVETIAGAHGGHARAANLAGGGADVWIELPGAGDGGT